MLAGERGHLAALRGEAWTDQLDDLLAMRSATGLVPEQVWDLAPLLPGSSGAAQPLYTGRATLSATPLVWGHSELVKLALTGPTASPVERLRIVADYFAADHAPAVSHFRTRAKRARRCKPKGAGGRHPAFLRPSPTADVRTQTRLSVFGPSRLYRRPADPLSATPRRNDVQANLGIPDSQVARGSPSRS